MPCHSQRPFCFEFSRIKEPWMRKSIAPLRLPSTTRLPTLMGTSSQFQLAQTSSNNSLAFLECMPQLLAVAAPRPLSCPLHAPSGGIPGIDLHVQTCGHCALAPVPLPSLGRPRVRTRFRSESISTAVCALELYRPQSNAICICQAHSI